MPELDDRWNPGLWLGRSLASDEHYVGTSAGVRRCRSIWRRPGKQRSDRKMLTEMNGEPWNPTAHHHDKPPQVRGVYITLERQIKHGGTKGCAACFWHAKVHSPECRARFQDILEMKLHRQQLRVRVKQTSRCQNRQRVAPRPVQVEDRCRLRVDPRRRMPTWKLQRARQHCRRVLWFERWKLRTTRVQNVRD